MICTKDGVGMMRLLCSSFTVWMNGSVLFLSELGPCSLLRSVLKIGNRNSFTISSLVFKNEEIIHLTARPQSNFGLQHRCAQNPLMAEIQICDITACFSDEWLVVLLD